MEVFIKQEPKEIHKRSFKEQAARYGKIILAVLKWVLGLFLMYSILPVILFSFIPPPATPLMVIRAFEQKGDSKTIVVDKKWVPIEEISSNLVNAVVAAEDNRFMSHWGIDREAIQDAIEYNKKSTRTRGASTITQQVAKNLFLWPSRTYFRKGMELYFTFMIELFWNKKRIMEMYLNIIETGSGLYGAEAAAQKYFHKAASQLTREEAALIAISLPNPRIRNPATPTAYMIRRQHAILDLMNKIENVKFD